MDCKVIAIAGSTGFIAGELMHSLKEFEIIRLTRNDFLLNHNQLAEKLKNADVVINLAGSPIIKRWTSANKKKIYNSRVETTSKLVNAVLLLNKSVHFINASAIGIYSEQNIHTEESGSYSEGFIYEVISSWEKEAEKLKDHTVHHTIIRIGIVLARNAGLLKKILPFFKVGLGGKIGSGNQWMSFIHIDDLVRAIKFIISAKITGIVNITAPEYITNKEFTRILAGLMNRPAYIPVPAFLIKMLYGEGSGIIISSHRVLPAKLQKSGFEFKYPDINGALRNLTVH